MDRRQRKTREAIFDAFTALLSQKDFSKITVEDIITRADIGRATFYAHFETKEFLLKVLCEELFCHVFDTANHTGTTHRHIFECGGSDSVFLHIAEHFKRNDNQLRTLLSSRNNGLFLAYFEENLERLITDLQDASLMPKRAAVPDDFWKHYIVSTFIHTLTWWIANGMKESPAVITSYFLEVL